MRVNMGNFEHVIVTSEIEVELDDDSTVQVIDGVTERLNARLDLMVEDEIRDMVAAQGNQDSFIYTWAENREIS